jgi:hypothetical protein
VRCPERRHAAILFLPLDRARPSTWLGAGLSQSKACGATTKAEGRKVTKVTMVRIRSYGGLAAALERSESVPESLLH